MKSRPPSIAIVIPGIDRIGGAEQQALLLAHGLHARGWHVHVVALTGCGGASGQQLAAAGIGFTSLCMRHGLADPGGWLRYYRWLRLHRPDVVHAHLPHAVWLARWSRLTAPVPVLVDTIHTSATGSLGRRLAYRFSRWIPDEVSAVSQSVADAYLAANMVVNQRLSVVPNGIDTTYWKPNPEERKATRHALEMGGDFVFLAAGRIEPVKDYPTLLTAMAGLPASARLIIAGSGALESDLRTQAADLRLNDHVRFLGFEPNLRGWMQAADAFVLTSRWEGLPMGLLEAAACGLPAVATDVPGTRDAVIDAETGFLAPAGDAEALRHAMERMMVLHADQRAKLGRQARARVLERFSLDRVLDRWERLYGNLLERNQDQSRWAGC